MLTYATTTNRKNDVIHGHFDEVFFVLAGLVSELRALFVDLRGFALAPAL